MIVLMLGLSGPVVCSHELFNAERPAYIYDMMPFCKLLEIEKLATVGHTGKRLN